MNFRRSTTSLALLSSFLWASATSAQDPSAQTTKPNILFVVDTSGSMEYKTGSEDFPTCNPDDTLATNEKSRWVQVIEALSGSIQGYSCDAMARDTSEFEDEYAMPGTSAAPPPDLEYRNPYHRPLSYGCVMTPDHTAQTNAFSWTPPIEADYPVTPSALAPCSTPFSQSGDGVVDSFNDLVRFGLMTFDPLPGKGKGYTGASSTDYADGVEGTWSYFPAGTASYGHPAGCPEDEMNQTFEVGVRNAAAPASEGKMIYFGDPFSDANADDDRHDRLQEVLLATRPYGATPLNGALDDVRAFFRTDSTSDPLDPVPSSPTSWISPKYDPYVNCGCREQHVILVTDGEPNLDLRPDCEGATGKCPYEDDPATIIADLYDTNTATVPGDDCVDPSVSVYQHSIRTHVIGYSSEKFTTGGVEHDCADLQTDFPDWETGLCLNPTDADTRVCCTLHELAKAGSATSASADERDSNGLPHIAPDGSALKAVITDILSSLLGGAQSATRPVRSPGIGAADNIAAFRLLTSYEATSEEGKLWRGRVERLRWVCDAGGTAVEQPRDLSAGDSFDWNAANNKDDRVFVTWLPSTYTTDDLRHSIRPHLNSTADGVTGTTIPNVMRVVDSGTNFVSDVSATALNVVGDTTTCPGATSDAACRDRIMNWLLGNPDGEGNNRCPTSSYDDCSVIGDVMHSTPVIVNRPSAPVEDPTYDAFAQLNQGRMMMAYTSSNDGFLHGFAASPNSGDDSPIDDDTDTNERFAALIPYLLPEIKSQYPGTRQKLNDGTAVVQDVVATEISDPDYPYLLERETTTDAGNADAATTATWRTVLVQSFGGAHSGYFALDVTNAKSPSASNEAEGPQFLWQLTTTESGQALFGEGGTPAITTINLQGTEVAVAILPGGKGPGPTGSGPRSDPDIANPSQNTHYLTGVSGSDPPREDINQYPSGTPAISLTVVRLDSGEIIRTFRRDVDLGALTELSTSVVTSDSTSTTQAYLDSPITGTPAVYPAGVGMISDRVFVGDQDGTLWRVDLSNPDPEQWTMKLFHDAYGGETYDSGHAIAVPPLLSVDEIGQITVAFGTGTQDLSGGANDLQYVYSLTEAEHATGFVASQNWYHEWDTGEHILGPMSLLAGTLYFATFNPATNNPCGAGSARIYGEHFTIAEPTGAPAAGGEGRLAIQGTGTMVQSETVGDAINIQSGGSSGDGVTSVFGFSLEFTPSCYDTSEADLSYLAGSQTRVSNASASQLQLVFQTADTVVSDQGGLDFETGLAAVTLAPPPQASRILSWGAILD